MKVQFIQDTIDKIRKKQPSPKVLPEMQDISFDFIKKESEKSNRGFVIDWQDRLIILGDNTAETSFDTHYVYHTALALRKVLQLNPRKHVDISSSLYFCTALSSLLPVDFYDFRPASLKLNNLNCHSCDITKLPFNDKSLESLSSMHVVEHIGLGRYGDELDVNGDVKAINELKRVLAKNGHLIFVVPVGKPKIVFNAHRIYSYEQIMQYFSDLTLTDSYLIPDDALTVGAINKPDSDTINKQDYGCGIFVFRKDS